MTIQRIALGFVLPAILLMSHGALAQITAGNVRGWDNVRALKPESKIAVELRNGAIVEGKLRSVSFNTLTLEKNNQSRDLDRTDIRKVYHLRRRIGRTTWRGTVIGYRITAPFRHFLGGGGCRGGGLGCLIADGAALALIVAIIPAGTAGGATAGLVHQGREITYENP